MVVLAARSSLLPSREAACLLCSWCRAERLCLQDASNQNKAISPFLSLAQVSSVTLSFDSDVGASSRASAPRCWTDRLPLSQPLHLDQLNVTPASSSLPLSLAVFPDPFALFDPRCFISGAESGRRPSLLVRSLESLPWTRLRHLEYRGACKGGFTSSLARMTSISPSDPLLVVYNLQDTPFVRYSTCGWHETLSSEDDNVVKALFSDILRATRYATTHLRDGSLRFVVAFASEEDREAALDIFSRRMAELWFMMVDEGEASSLNLSFVSPLVSSSVEIVFPTKATKVR